MTAGRCFFCASLFAALFTAAPAKGQQVVSYGADFLATGAGGRALGMGGAHIALADDVSAGYWNPAGLSRTEFPEVEYMHAERFAGIVSFDYGAVAWPVNARSTLGASFFRSGVNDIKNTLDAWDPERNQPRPHAEEHITSFSAADAAFFVSYARLVRTDLAAGVTAKIIRRSIGDFADAWGYSFDVGGLYRRGAFMVGVNLQDAAGMRQSWNVNRDLLSNIQDVFGQTIPKGGVETVLPLLRLGSGYVLDFGAHHITLGLDVDMAFEGQQAYVLHTGGVSYHPRLGVEYGFRKVMALRAGFTDILKSEREGWNAAPTVGAGLHLGRLAINYGFGNFAGLASDLGYTHRISARVVLARGAWRRAAE